MSPASICGSVSANGTTEWHLLCRRSAVVVLHLQKSPSRLGKNQVWAQVGRSSCGVEKLGSVDQREVVGVTMLACCAYVL